VLGSVGDPEILPPIKPPARPEAMISAKSARALRSFDQKKSPPRMPATSRPIRRPFTAARHAPRAAQAAAGRVSTGRSQVESGPAKLSTDAPTVTTEYDTIKATDTATPTT
jgi:hypothetical protein